MSRFGYKLAQKDMVSAFVNLHDGVLFQCGNAMRTSKSVIAYHESTHIAMAQINKTVLFFFKSAMLDNNGNSAGRLRAYYCISN